VFHSIWNAGMLLAPLQFSTPCNLKCAFALHVPSSACSMSSLTIVGFFAVANGERVVSTKPGTSTRTAHCFYTTAVQCSSSAALPAQLRVYSPQHDTPLADGTVAFVVAKAAFPPHSTVLLDAYFMIPIPGDPSSESYDDALPDMPYPLLFGLGSVPSKTEQCSNGTRAFQVSVAEYVRDSSKASNIECVYTTPRWTNAPSPNVNSTVEFIGICARVTSTGVPSIDLLNIVLNAGTQPSAPPAQPPNTPKRKRFSAFASSPSPSPAPSTSAASTPSPSDSVTTNNTTTVSSSGSLAASSPLTIRLRSAVGSSSATVDETEVDDNDTVPDAAVDAEPSPKALGKRKTTK